MTRRTCKWCGTTFTPPPTRGGNNRQYCTDTCRAKAYNTHRNNARNKYNKLHPRIRATTRLCEWCAHQFISTQNRKYCSMKCKREARKEQNIRGVQKYRSAHGKTDKQRYFDGLGTGNLREHRNNSFPDEERLIRAEKRRLHI